MAAEIRGWRGEGFAVRLVVDDERQAERLRRMLSEHELEAWPGVTLWSSEGLGVVVGECAAGFQLPALGLVVLSEQEVFGAQRRRLRRPAFQRGAAIAAFTDLAPNDLVVHEMHGIARYHGLRTLATDGRDADFLLLEYADGGRLYLPVERLDLISKYMGAPDGAARLDRLGGVAWGRVKDSVRAALRAMAEELLRLYAARSVVERSAFSGDSAWQGEFEAAFRFEETRDQMRAIEDVKADMASPRPMDRLVAGDVGYGKTEVALRAAFKAVADGRQVAVLVPTTVLAQQHFNTFSERFGPFPARVELLSRFRSPKEQKAVDRGTRPRRRGRRDRHPPPPVQGRHVQEPGPPGDRRGAPLRRHPQGAHQDPAHRGGRAHAHRHADPAHAEHGALRRARPLADRDAAARPAAGGDRS